MQSPLETPKQNSQPVLQLVHSFVFKLAKESWRKE